MKENERYAISFCFNGMQKKTWVCIFFLLLWCPILKLEVGSKRYILKPHHNKFANVSQYKVLIGGTWPKGPCHESVVIRFIAIQAEVVRLGLKKQRGNHQVSSVLHPGDLNCSWQLLETLVNVTHFYVNFTSVLTFLIRFQWSHKVFNCYPQSGHAPLSALVGSVRHRPMRNPHRE